MKTLFSAICFAACAAAFGQAGAAAKDAGRAAAGTANETACCKQAAMGIYKAKVQARKGKATSEARVAKAATKRSNN